MSVAVAPPAQAPPDAPRLTAFCARGAAEVFHSIATPTEIWRFDPFDVDSIHLPSREAFERMLHRGARIPAPPSGAVLVLTGEAGSGKTHLMRAFRTRAHGQGLGYCGYMQMTTEVSSYPRYMLQNLVNGLELPYAPDGPSRTGLNRLTAALLEMVPGLDAAAQADFRAGTGDSVTLVEEYADRLKGCVRFQHCDLNLLRVMLHYQREDPRVKPRTLMWLRCEEMTIRDREWLGGLAAPTDEAHPLEMLRQLARLTDAVHGVPLVLLLDQLEDIANLLAPIERFRKVVDALTAFTDQVPNAVVVLACLEDYFKANVGQVIQAKRDRLMRDPEPVRLTSSRTLDEIRAIIARRLACLYAEADVSTDSDVGIYPFREAHLLPLQNLRSRDVLDFLRRHHQKCILRGEWSEPDTGPSPLPPPPPPPSDLSALWNDFHTSFKPTVPDEEEALAAVLARAITGCAAERSDGIHFGEPRPDGRYLEIETHRSGNAIDKLLVALCNRGGQGNGLKRQLDEVEKRMGDFPVAVVRTLDFPKSGKAMEQIAKMLKRDGRRVVVPNAEWRRMLSFEAFAGKHGSHPEFAEWRRADQPLGEMKSLQDILRLKSLATSTPAAKPAQLPAAQKPEPPARPADLFSELTPEPASSRPLTIRLGQTIGRLPTAVAFEPKEFTRHAAFLGGSGSGKTTAALNLLEQLLATGVPAVLIDRKGDLCRYADPAAWNRSLGDPSRTAGRQWLRDRLDVAVFTPGEPRGRPLALPILPPGFADLPEADREQFAQYSAAALGGMMGMKGSDTDRQQQAILAKAIEVLAATPGTDVTVPELRTLIDEQDPSLVAAVGGFEGRVYQKLADRLLTLWLNNRALLQGDEVLDVDALLGTGSHARPGRTRLTVISTRFLADPVRLEFWVAQLLIAVGRWCGKAPSPELQAVFLFDEADLYLPAVKQPPTKAPMENLLKRARSAGVGIFLATQSPGDFDYKCKENVSSWLIGKVKEPRALEKLRPMLAAGRSDAADRLAGQPAGDFHLIRDANVNAVHSDESYISTEQLPENRIIELARSTQAKSK